MVDYKQLMVSIPLVYLMLILNGSSGIQRSMATRVTWSHGTVDSPGARPRGSEMRSCGGAGHGNGSVIHMVELRSFYWVSGTNWFLYGFYMVSIWLLYGFWLLQTDGDQPIRTFSIESMAGRWRVPSSRHSTTEDFCQLPTAGSSKLRRSWTTSGSKHQ